MLCKDTTSKTSFACRLLKELSGLPGYHDGVLLVILLGIHASPGSELQVFRGGVPLQVRHPHPHSSLQSMLGMVPTNNPSVIGIGDFVGHTCLSRDRIAGLAAWCTTAGQPSPPPPSLQSMLGIVPTNIHTVIGNAPTHSPPFPQLGACLPLYSL